MKKWNMYKKDNGEIEVVKEGFNWWAFFFVGVWAFTKSLTWAGVIGLSLTMIANKLPTDSNIIAFPTIIALMLVYGFMGNSWVAAKYEKQQYLFLKQVEAESAEGAKAKLDDTLSSAT